MHQPFWLLRTTFFRSLGWENESERRYASIFVSCIDVSTHEAYTWSWWRPQLPKVFLSSAIIDSIIHHAVRLRMLMALVTASSINTVSLYHLHFFLLSIYFCILLSQSVLCWGEVVLAILLMSLISCSNHFPVFPFLEISFCLIHQSIIMYTRRQFQTLHILIEIQKELVLNNSDYFIPKIKIWERKKDKIKLNRSTIVWTYEL